MEKKRYYHFAYKFEINPGTCELEGKWFAYKRKRDDSQVFLHEDDDGIFGDYDNGFYVAAWNLENAKQRIVDCMKIHRSLLQKMINEISKVDPKNIPEEDDSLLDFTEKIGKEN